MLLFEKKHIYTLYIFFFLNTGEQDIFITRDEANGEQSMIKATKQLVFAVSFVKSSFIALIYI